MVPLKTLLAATDQPPFIENHVNPIHHPPPPQKKGKNKKKTKKGRLIVPPPVINKVFGL